MAYKIDTNRKTIKAKIDEVKTTVEEIKKYKTLVLLDLRQLPDALFQNLRKSVRNNGGKVFVLRKAVVSRVLDANPKLKDFVKECDKPIALICTDKSPYEMNVFFKENKKMRAAKLGDIATSEIVVPEGETDLPPGPALSELKAAGVNAQIKGGKIAVVKASTVAKEGEVLTAPKVKALTTLGVKPFEIMAKFIMGFDGHYIYARSLLDSVDTLNTDIAGAFGQANNVSLNLSYPTGANINVLLGSAVKQGMNVSLNGNLYSTSSMEQLLVSVIRQGTALSSLEKK
jgi:large subunit ribosomal protein L10